MKRVDFGALSDGRAFVTPINKRKENDMKYALMREEREVLEFDVDLSSGAVSDVRPLEDVSWAPLGVFDGVEPSEAGLSQFIEDRSISVFREDLPAILDATGARNPIELAFRANGFSLSDPYWYRAQGSALTWKRGNFFDNTWDPSFGNAVLRKDYDALKKASTITPDVTCSGSCRKAWLRDEMGPYLIKAPTCEGGASTIGEVLASNMLSRVLPENEYLPYELVEGDGEMLSASRPLVSPGEELIMAWQALSEAKWNREREEPAISLLGYKLLDEYSFALAQAGIEGSGQVIPKMMVLSHLTFSRDMHPRNLGIIRTTSGALRLAPFFDFDRTFALSHRDQIEQACAHPEITILLMASTFSKLDPSWDYSWYDPQALDGFEHEITRAFSACKELPENFAEFAAKLFVLQRTYVNRTVASE